MLECYSGVHHNRHVWPKLRELPLRCAVVYLPARAEQRGPRRVYLPASPCVSVRLSAMGWSAAALACFEGYLGPEGEVSTSRKAASMERSPKERLLVVSLLCQIGYG